MKSQIPLYEVCFAVNYSINLEYSRTYIRYTAKHLHTMLEDFQRVMELEANQVQHSMI